VFLLRHGESTFNEKRRCQGSSDESILTEQGVSTALKTAQYLKEHRPEVILSSPLRRARQTAEIIFSECNGSGAKLEFHDLLKEIHLAHWEGLTFDQIRSNFSSEYQTWKERPLELHMPQAGKAHAPFKPVVNLYRRATRFWKEVLPRLAGKRILVVSHGGTTRALIGAALRISARFYHRTQHSNGGLSILEFHVTHPGGCRIEALNLTCHLHSHLPKLKDGKQGVRLVLLPLDPAASPPQFLRKLRPDFVSGPQAYVLSPAQFQEGIVRTIVLTAPIDSLVPILMTAAGVRRPDCARWDMREGHISVLHYPHPNAGAVLQTFNLPIGAISARTTGDKAVPDALMPSGCCEPASPLVFSTSTNQTNVV
jgi:broad specificity phosphatase PhoE